MKLLSMIILSDAQSMAFLLYNGYLDIGEEQCNIDLGMLSLAGDSHYGGKYG